MGRVAGTSRQRQPSGEQIMQIDKDQIISLLRQRGDDAKADQAQQELPGQVDTEKDSGLLSKLGIDPTDLLGGLGNKLGL
jgi:hypothetical protein